MNNIKCSLKKHSNLAAVSYCKECKKYFCNKCQNYHSELFENHNLFNLAQHKDEIFTGLCTKENHNNELQFYCENHNELCCSSCLCKIKELGNGQHKDCDVVGLEKIKIKKKNKLKENIQILENLSITIEKSLEELNQIIEKINQKKEVIIIEIQKFFTKIRNKLNEREDEILLEIDKRFNEQLCDENIIKKGEKLPEKN